MKQLRRILAGAAALSLMAPLLIAGAEPEGGGHSVPDAFDNRLVIENSQYAFGLDPATGLGSLFDKQTGELWNQYYAAPAVETPVCPIDFSDAAVWTIENAQKENPRANENTVLFRLDGMEKNGVINMNYPGMKIIKGNYKLRLTYTAEKAVGFGFDMAAHMYRNKLNTTSNGDNWLNSFKAPSATFFTEQNGRDTLELDIPASGFQEHTGTFNISLNMLVAEGATGSVTVEKLELVGQETAAAPVTITGARKDGDTLRLQVNSDFRAAAGLPAADCAISFDEDNTLRYSLTMADKNAPFEERIQYPPAFHNGSDSLQWMLPKDSGLLLTSTDLASELNKRLTISEFYCAGGLNMGFYGGVDAAAGSGYLAVVDTPVNATVVYPQSQIGEKQGFLPVIAFTGDKDVWKEDRQVRFRFLRSGSYVELSKAYRSIAKEKGYLVTYAEKAETNPWIERTAVAHRVDLGIDKRAILTYFDMLAEAGIDNVMTKTSGVRDSMQGGAYVTVEELIEDGVYREIMEKYPDALLYEYENTRDVYLTEGEFKLDPDFVSFAQDYLLKGKTGKYFYGWTDITGVSANILCQSVNKAYVDYWLQRRPLDVYPTHIKMYDVLATCNLAEGQCYDHNHPFDRTDTYNSKRDLVKYVVDKGMDAHTEGTAEYLVPYCTSFEGSLGFMNITGVGNPTDMMTRENGIANEAERIPLWQLVFHDCGGTYWHWEFGSLDAAERNEYCDLFSLLYGERGMFGPFYSKTHLGSSYFKTMLERIKKLNTVLLEAGTDELADHRFLSDDGKVQRTVFSSGLQVTVNFSREKSYTIDGQELAPMGYTVEKSGGRPIDPTGTGATGGTPEPAEGLPLWAYVAIGAGVGAVLAGGAIALLRLKKKH